jgi:hypothetical protein
MGFFPDILYLGLSVLLGIAIAVGTIALLMPAAYQRLISFIRTQ